MTRRRPASPVLLATVVALVTARRISLGWGASADERRLALPGDEIVVFPDLEATRGITISAPAAQVWPWVVQIGQGRGGFYSYDRLEDLARLGIRSADKIMPEHQDLAVGDAVHLAEQIARVATTVDAGTALVLSATSNGPQVPTDSTPAARPAMPYEFSWAFVLVPVDDRSCRLVVRERYGYTAPWVALLVEPVEWVSLLMTQRMLRGIRDRAEARAPEPSVSAGRRDATR